MTIVFRTCFSDLLKGVSCKVCLLHNQLAPMLTAQFDELFC